MNKLLFDFLPLILFFVALKFGDIYIATEVAIAVTVLQFIWLKVTHKPISVSNWINLIVIVLFGGATIYLHDETFVKWKPTVLYWVFALIMLGAQFIFKKNVLQSLIGKELTLPDPVWKRLTLAWSIFFIIMGGLNLFIAFSGFFTTIQWASFKVFGATILLIIFVIGQSVYLSKYIKEQPKE